MKNSSSFPSDKNSLAGLTPAVTTGFPDPTNAAMTRN